MFNTVLYGYVESLFKACQVVIFRYELPEWMLPPEDTTSFSLYHYKMTAPVFTSSGMAVWSAMPQTISRICDLPFSSLYSVLHNWVGSFKYLILVYFYCMYTCIFAIGFRYRQFTRICMCCWFLFHWLRWCTYLYTCCWYLFQWWRVFNDAITRFQRQLCSSGAAQNDWLLGWWKQHVRTGVWTAILQWLICGE